MRIVRPGDANDSPGLDPDDDEAPTHPGCAGWFPHLPYPEADAPPPSGVRATPTR